MPVMSRRHPLRRVLGSRLLVLAGCLWFLAAPGCGPSPRTAPPDELTLFALHPNEGAPRTTRDSQFLYGFRILGRSVIKEPERRAELLGAIVKAAEESGGERANCFGPRHALRVKDAGLIREYVICFECSVMELHAGGQKTEIPITKSASSLFNRFLKEEGLPVPK